VHILKAGTGKLYKGVVTSIGPVEPSATGIKVFGGQNLPLDYLISF